MKKISILIYFILLCFIVIGQTGRSVVVLRNPKIVPMGKKWILEAGKTTRIQVSYGVLNSGTLCNGLFLSNPQMVSSLNCGTFSEAEAYMIIFNDHEKVPYTNENTFDITIRSITDKGFSIYDLQKSSPENVGKQKIEFHAGESVFVSNCLESIELKEKKINKAELLELKKQADMLKNVNERNKSNFNIPVNPEKYVEPGTKPTNHDAKLKSMEFSCSSVLHKKPGGGYSLDNDTKWTLELNANELKLNSSNGIEKSYFVIKIDYDDKIRMQKFLLGDINKRPTHNLYVAWSNGSNQYSIILSSTDDTEEYQFQEINLVEKQFYAN